MDSIGIIKETLSLFKGWATYPLERLKKKKEHDIEIYNEITDIVSPEVMKDFFYTLGYDRYEEKHLRAVYDYFYYSRSVDKYFFDRKIQGAKIKFDKSLDELRIFLSIHFFRPKNPNLEHYQLYPDLDDIPKREKFFRERQVELYALQDTVEEKYDKFIKTAKNRLLI